MVKNYTCHVFKPMYLKGYRLLKILNESTLLLVTPNGRVCKTNNDLKSAVTLKVIENAWHLFLN